MTDPGTSCSGPSAPPLIDVNLRVRRSVSSAFLVVIAAVLGVVVVSMAGITADVMSILLFTAIQVTFICALLYLVDRVSIVGLRRRIEYLVRANPHFPVAQLAERSFAERSLLGPERRLELLARALAATGRVGETIRNCPLKHVTPIEPITVPFEPLPLDDDELSFDEPGRPLDDQPDADLLEPEALERLRAEGSGEARPEQKARKGVGWFTAGLLVLPTTAGAMHAFVRGEITWPAILFSVIVLFALIGWGQATGLLVEKEWLIVPSGLVLREARLRSTKWDLHLFDRRDSVLIAHRVNSDRWIVFVTGAEGARKATLTSSQADFLLRAWLSPLPPPRVEQLTDLT